MKTSKRIISLVLCAVMVLGTFLSLGPVVSFKAEAATTLGGITQQRVVGTDGSYESLYRSYQKSFFNGEETNWPTNFIIPGLGSSDDYTPQGMTYWKEKEWILISAYDAGGSDPSVIYALDAVTTEFVALFKLQNADGTTNTSHGGGIAASEYNFYYADSDSKISYFPISEMDVADKTVKTIKLCDSIDLKKEMTGAETGKTVKTSYCCYDDGILWTGNFQWDDGKADTTDDSAYNNVYHATYKSILMGYKLAGNSSEEEWYYLKNGFNHIILNSANIGEVQTVDKGVAGIMKYTANSVDGANIEIRGTVTAESPSGAEITSTSNSDTIGTFHLTEGKKYKIEYITDNTLTDIYMWSSAGTHCNIKSSSEKVVTDLGDGRYHYELVFTAGLRPTGADSGWPTTQSTNGSYTGTYKFRFDQDSITETRRDFNITDLSITEYVEPQGFTPDSRYEGIGCEGNPTYVIAMNTDRIQYAMVDKGKLYVSRSWSRKESGNHTRELMIADIDLGSPGNTGYTVNGRARNIYLINYDDAGTTHFGGNYKDGDNLSNMLWMGEALCVIDDYLYMFSEGAAWAYNGKASDNKCGQPIDVIWKIDQYAIQGLTRTHDDVASVEYKQVKSLSEINSTDEYIILYESPLKDPVTQDNILYLLDAYGGYGDKKLPKKISPVSNTNDFNTVYVQSTGDSRGIVGYAISDYDVKYDEKGNKSIILSEADDANKSLHWQFESGSSANLKLKNRDLYFAKHPYLYSGDKLFAMTSTASSTMKINDWGNGDFTIYGNGTNYALWCNDGEVADSITKYTNFYSNHGESGYLPGYHGLEEIPGTFHVANTNQPALPTGDQQGLHIYRRVTNPYGSTYETNVYTDLKANLQADGTYNITLETYATNDLQYKRTENAQQRPTDFVVVVDSCGLMDKGDLVEYYNESGWSSLRVDQACGFEPGKNNSYFSDGDHYNTIHQSYLYYKFPDGEFGHIYCAFNKKDESYSRDLWLWAEHPITGRCYRLSKYGFMTHGNFSGGADWNQDNQYRITDEAFLSNQQNLGWANRAAVQNDINNDRYRTDYHSKRNSTAKRAEYDIMYYSHSGTYNNQTVSVSRSYYDTRSVQRIKTIQTALSNFVSKVEADITSTGRDHRIALVTYGSGSVAASSAEAYKNTGLYTTDGSFRGYTSASSYYGSALFSKSQFSTLKTKISNLPQGGHSFPSYGLEMASKIIDKNKSAYSATGDRSAVVVVISTGVPAYIDEAAYNQYGLNETKKVANETLANGAYSLKRNSAHVYTILLGDAKASTGNRLFTQAEFNEQDFMKYLSSQYTGAKSMTDPGALNTQEGADLYYEHVPVGANIETFDNILTNVLASSKEKSSVAISSLTDKSVLRERLTDAFDLTGATVTCQVAKSEYDGIGRLGFKTATAAPSGITAALDKTNHNLEVTGFDYSANNVSEYNSNKGLGNKLIVTIKGVTADPSKTLTSAAINDKDYTALYESETHKVNNIALKQFQTYHFAIPEYTYVLDYDLPMLDTDINGTLISASELPNKQTTYVKDLQTDVFGVKFIDGDQNMLYSLNSQEGSAEDNSRAYILIKRDDGTYDWFRLNLIPASTVYYEDNKTATLASTKDKGYATWTPRGDYTNKYQSLSSSSDVYGYEPTYGNSTDKFSLGTYLETTVSSTNNRSETKTFAFKGTGFDLYSACGPETGIQTVTVKDGNGSIKKVFIVDTFYNDTKYGEIAQVPIVHFEGAYGDYTVETTAAYYTFAGALKTQSAGGLEIEGTDIDATSAVADVSMTDELFRQIGMDELIGQEVEVIWMDENSIFNGGTGADRMSISTQDSLGTSTTEKTLVNYIDGFRIYNPLNTDDEDYPVDEQGATYHNVIGNLGSGAMTGKSLFGYVENQDGAANFADYSSLTGNGPKNEVYLTSNTNNGVSFKIKYSGDNASAKISLRAVKGTPTVTVNGKTIAVTSTSEQYYDITGALGTAAADGTYTVTIKVSSSGTTDLVAVGNLRLNNASLTALANEDLPNVARLMTMSASPIDYDPTQAYVEPPVFVEAPADDPDIDPEGSIPTLEEYQEEKFEEDKQTFFEMVVDFFKSIIERIKEVLQALPVLWTRNIKEG